MITTETIRFGEYLIHGARDIRVQVKAVTPAATAWTIRPLDRRWAGHRLMPNTTREQALAVGRHTAAHPLTRAEARETHRQWWAAMDEAV